MVLYRLTHLPSLPGSSVSVLLRCWPGIQTLLHPSEAYLPHPGPLWPAGGSGVAVCSVCTLDWTGGTCSFILVTQARPVAHTAESFITWSSSLSPSTPPESFHNYKDNNNIGQAPSLVTIRHITILFTATSLQPSVLLTAIIVSRGWWGVGACRWQEDLMSCLCLCWHKNYLPALNTSGCMKGRLVSRAQSETKTLEEGTTGYLYLGLTPALCLARGTSTPDSHLLTQLQTLLLSIDVWNEEFIQS